MSLLSLLIYIFDQFNLIKIVFIYLFIRDSAH